MWSCPVCGTENEEKGRFCVGCGQPRPEPTTQLATEQDWQLPLRQPVPPVRREEPRPRASGWPWLVIAGLAMVAAALVLLVIIRKTNPPVTGVAVATAEPTDPAVIVVTPAPTIAPAPTTAPTPEPTGAPAGPVLLTDASQVSEAGDRQLRDNLEGIVAHNVSSSWNTEEHLTRSEYVGFYLLTAKSANADVQNRLILVCRNEVSIVIPKENVNKSLSYYYSVVYDNVTVNPDGTLNLGKYQEPGTNVKADVYRHNYYYYGHETLEGVYNYWVRPETGGYEVTMAGSVW